MDKLILYGDLVGYQFNKKSMGKRAVSRQVYPIGFIYNRQYGVARWKGLDWLCSHFSGNTWIAIEAMQSLKVPVKMGTKSLQSMYKIHDEIHQETGQRMGTWLYDGLHMIRTTVITERDGFIVAERR